MLKVFQPSVSGQLCSVPRMSAYGEVPLYWKNDSHHKLITARLMSPLRYQDPRWSQGGHEMLCGIALVKQKESFWCDVRKTLNFPLSIELVRKCGAQQKLKNNLWSRWVSIPDQGCSTDGDAPRVRRCDAPRRERDVGNWVVVCGNEDVKGTWNVVPSTS